MLIENPLNYIEFVKQLKEKYEQVKFVNFSISALGFFDKTSSDFTDMMKDLHVRFVVRKIINIAIGASFNVFCYRN